MRYVLLAAVLVLCVPCSWSQTEAPVTLGGVTYDRVDPGEPFTEATKPVQDWAPPAPTAAETAAGMLAYVAPDPGEYRPYRLPRAQERTDRLQVFLCPGEDEPVTFAVYTLAELKGLTITADLKNAPVTVDVRQEHCWPQRTGWRSRQWYTTPELLLPCADGKKTVPYQRGILKEVPFDLAAGQSQGFWLTLSASAEARPGRYEAVVSVAAADKPALQLPLTIEVLPIKLQRPADRSWLIYADSSRWDRMSEDQALAELRDFRSHGMDGLVEGNLGTPDVSKLREGKVTYDASRFRKYTELCRRVGMEGPHVINSAGPNLVKSTLGITADLTKGQWPTEVTAGVQAIAKAAVAATADIPAKWYYYGVDEPTGDNTYAIQDYQAWHDGGARTYATFYVPSFLEKASAYLSAPCFVVGLVSNEKRAQEAREACEKTGAEFWWYGTGSYVNPFPQEGYLWHNRYGAGLLFWKTGARAEVTWTFCRPHEDVFNDFDGSRANSGEPKEQCTAYPHFLKPDDWSSYQGAIPTIAWEALREGVDDYLYLYTLTSLIKQAQASPIAAAQKAAEEAQATLQGLVDSVPWVNPMGPVGFETKRLQQIRRMVADRILGLQAALAGQAYNPPSLRGEQFSLRVKTRQVPTGASLPVMSAGSTSTAPTLDGKLDDHCWQDAGVAANFVDIRDGEPAALATTARLLVDDKALYVGFDCPEPRMEAVEAKETQHDGTVWLEDEVELFVGGAARRPYAHLIVTTANVVLDERNQDMQAWDPKLQTAVYKGADRWSVEIAIPWSELAAAGVNREPIMAFNFARARHTGVDPQTHTAWSCTYNGLHIPERFGLALMQPQTVALEELRAPAEWGSQAFGVTLRNTSTAPVSAQVAVRGAGRQVAGLAPGEKRRFEIPLSLRRSGDRRLNVSWGVLGQTATRLQVPTTVPEPMAVALTGALVSPGGAVDASISLGLSPCERKVHQLVVRVTDSKATKECRLPAWPGLAVDLPVRTAGSAQVKVLLVDDTGKTVAESPAHRVMVLAD